MVKRKAPKKPVLNGAESVHEAHIVDNPSSFGDPEFFPYARYTSIVGVNTSLLVFVGLFLPRSTTFFDMDKSTTPPFQATSRDRPQHPFLEPLTADPVATLAYICLGVMVLQAWWSGWVRHWWIDHSLKGARDDKKMQKQDIDKRKLAQFGKAWLFAIAISAVFYVAIVLLGAPLISHLPQTYLLALVIAILTVVPPAYTFGLPSLSSDTESLLIRLTWIRLFAEFQIRNPIERAIVYPVIGTILGSWLGAIPIALDWDRPWQAWPLTPAYGAITGYIIASLAALSVSMVKALADEHIRSLSARKQN